MNTCIILRNQYLEESLSSVIIIIRHTPSLIRTHYNDFLIIYNKLESSMPNKNSIPFFSKYKDFGWHHHLKNLFLKFIL